MNDQAEQPPLQHPNRPLTIAHDKVKTEISTSDGKKVSSPGVKSKLLSSECHTRSIDTARSQSQKAPSANQRDKVSGKPSKTVFRSPKLQQEQPKQDITGPHDAKFKGGDTQRTDVGPEDDGEQLLMGNHNSSYQSY